MKKPCPICRGRKFTVSPVDEGFDCVFCANSGEVDTDFVCICGRPGVRNIKERIICLSEECGRKAEKGEFS